MKRVFLFVLDSCGCGEAPDAHAFGDYNVNTLRSCATSDKLHVPNMVSYGLGNIDNVDYLGKAEHQKGACARLQEASMGKDTTIGHWEIAGIVSPNPLPTYPNGFPEEILKPFREATGRGVLANAPWSGTEVIAKYGEEHMKTGDLIVYTSADSCSRSLPMRTSSRPSSSMNTAASPASCSSASTASAASSRARSSATRRDGFTRTSNRHDFSLEPPAETMLDAVKAAGLICWPSARSTISLPAAA